MPTTTRPQPTQTNGRVEPRYPDHARDETDRYRQAVQDALQQLDWCIGYLHGIRKSRISAQLAKNRAYIKRELLREPTQPLPTEVTNET